MSYAEFMLDQSQAQFMSDWAARNGWVILDSSTPDRPSKQQYASDHGGIVVPDPRGGKAGNTLIIKSLEESAP